MTEVTRIILISQAAPEAREAERFPSDVLPDPRGLDRLKAAADRLSSRATAWCGPGLAARASADALRLSATTTPALADLDHGDWCGRTLEEIAAQDEGLLSAWLTDSAVAPPGGDSARAVMKRVGAWLDGLGPGSNLLVAAPAAVRAALVHGLGSPDAWFHLDVGFGTESRLTRNAGRYRVSLVNAPI